ncbi:MAG: nucleotide sugar dehydrogenase [Verrucomicrobia bacterium]|nr:nucleotide sugar dehydrogenase [Verrucomicrobiota bacterium]
MGTREALERKIDAAQARIGIIGIGYVGLPLAVEFGRAGFTVIGFDVNPAKAESIVRGTSYIDDVPSEEVARLVKAGVLTATTEFSRLSECDAAIICVPTPLRKTKDPDISYIIGACEQIVRHGAACRLVVLESTTYPGTCEEVILPMLAAGPHGRGRRVGEDFFLCFSPERVDPGNAEYPTGKIPKVVGGITPACAEVAARLYARAVARVVPVSSARVAETVKLLENTFRSVNIGLINEIALMCHAMGIDVWEVIDGAATKPFGFIPFYPGPGLGGHCIPIDPLYLSWKAKLSKFSPKFIELAAEINEQMPEHVVRRAADILNDHAKPLRGSNVLVLGVAYKRDVSDVRESPAIEVIRLLREKGAVVEYADPHVPVFHEEGMQLEAVELTPERLAACDLAIIVTDHRAFDYKAVIEHARAIFDTRNATKNLDGRGKVTKL